jgi:hypothetical protein
MASKEVPMNDRDKRARENDALQSGEGDLALGQDERAFGAGKQIETRAFDPGHKDAPDRKTGRDPTVPRFEKSGDKK